MTRNFSNVLLIIAVAVFCFVGGLASEPFLTERGAPMLQALIAQVIPGTYQVAPDYEIPTVTDLSPISTFWQVREKIKRQFVYPIEQEEELTYGAIRGMLAALDDPYSRFLDPDEYGDFGQENVGHFDGIGAMLEAKTDPGGGEAKVIITQVMENGPASKVKNVKPGDRIIGVDGKSIRGLTLDEVVRRIRGERGSVVKLTLMREGVEDPFEVDIIRGNVDFPTVEYKMIDEQSKIGYLWLRSFNQQAEERTGAALRDLKSKGMKALLLDLSSDPGGILDAATGVAGFFLDGGPVVHIKGRDSEPIAMNASKGALIGDDIPLVVLVDAGSASASEIVAAALKERGRAEVVGQYTFGKSKVQTIIEMRDGSALFLSTAVYLTPDMNDIGIEDEAGKRGVKPDRLFDPPEADAEYTVEQWHQKQIDRALAVLKEKMQ